MANRYLEGFPEKRSKISDIPEIMMPLLEYFDPQIIKEIAQVFDTPDEYWEAMSGYNSRKLNNGQYDPRMDVLMELREQRLSS